MTNQTTPLAKAITTLEGQLVLASDVVLGAGAAVDPHVLPPKVAAIVVAAQHIALLVQRGVVKVQASPAVAEVVAAPDPTAALLKEVEEASGGVPTGV